MACSMESVSRLIGSQSLHLGFVPKSFRCDFWKNRNEASVMLLELPPGGVRHSTDHKCQPRILRIHHVKKHRGDKKPYERALSDKAVIVEGAISFDPIEHRKLRRLSC